ncbi:hypothetical protein Ppa06_40440 [Planomonospora parontospora subsp. parontospora]|uniref:Uncharacterized protein n=2 Tax=Planomonospora parontospora TaxID=58119 RepID=A0AA37F646_9ACTN|nr:hypothetical protein GCM10010126_43110 [Planomonospora parontospora]GII10246.1 hypothetical protein Ppa06_40440 [Planomonospora parontospora subsp. parontospora]
MPTEAAVLDHDRLFRAARGTAGLFPAIAAEHFQLICTTRLLGFETTFEADWYVSLWRPGDSGYELALLDPAHPTVPEGYGVPVRGLLL